MNRLMRILTLLVLLLTAAPLAPALAQETETTVENAAPPAIPGLAIARDEATAQFPDGITFSLEAETTDPIANVELLYNVPGLETYSVELPTFEVGVTALAIEQAVDLRSGDLPPGVDIQYRWRITEENGDIIETPEQTVPWLDDRYDWTPLSGEHVTVYTYDGNAAFQQEILDSAERTVESLSEAYGVTPDEPIRVWSYSNKDDLYGALAPNSEPWIAGAAYPGLHLIMAILPSGDSDELARVVPHEISHQVLHQATRNAFSSPPQWLDEGLATFWQESGRDRFYAHGLRLAAEGTIPPLRTLNGNFPYDPEGAMDAYALSLTAVIYILDTWGDEGMAKLIATFPEGITYEDAIQQGLGISFDELDRQWREDLIADADRLLGSGTTRFGDSGPVDGSPLSLVGDLLVAADSLIFGAVILIAVVAGLISFFRTRRQSGDDEDEESDEGVRWADWPRGLEPPGLQQQAPGQRG
jgi:hypothetical protein